MPPEETVPDVSVIIVTYNPNRALLFECLESVHGQNYSGLEVIIVDNGSREPALDPIVRAAWPNDGQTGSAPVVILALGRNTGFARATNLAIERASGRYCLVLNPDAVLHPGALRALVAAGEAQPDVLGFAPKVSLYRYPHILDSVGIDFAWSGDAFQRGLGEVDIGQFDVPGPVPGVGMGAALIRRAAFRPERAGPLDDRFFMFFEDVDWSLRASLCGERFATVPSAVVSHLGSSSVRERRFAWRYRLVERNVFYTAIKNYEKRHLTGFLLRRSAAHLRNLARGRMPVATVAALAGGWLGLLRLRASRHDVQRRRVRRDREAVAGRVPTVTAMDYLTWSPNYSWDSVRASLAGLATVTRDARWTQAVDYLDRLCATSVALPREEVVAELQRLAAPLPPNLLLYVGSLPDTVPPGILSGSERERSSRPS